MVNGCGVPGLNAHWVFFAATTNVDFTLTVTDTQTGVSRQYRNPYGQAADPVQDVRRLQLLPAELAALDSPPGGSDPAAAFPDTPAPSAKLRGSSFFGPFAAPVAFMRA